MTRERQKEYDKLFAKAEAEGLFFCERFYGLQITAKELRYAHKQGSYNWPSTSWELKSPQDLIDKIQYQAALEINAIKTKMNGSSHG